MNTVQVKTFMFPTQSHDPQLVRKYHSSFLNIKLQSNKQMKRSAIAKAMEINDTNNINNH